MCKHIKCLADVTAIMQVKYKDKKLEASVKIQYNHIVHNLLDNRKPQLSTSSDTVIFHCKYSEVLRPFKKSKSLVKIISILDDSF